MVVEVLNLQYGHAKPYRYLNGTDFVIYLLHGNTQALATPREISYIPKVTTVPRHSEV